MAEEGFLALGLMSGTSLDGIDAALLRTDGQRIFGFGPALTVAYESTFRERLRGVLGGQGAVDQVARDLTLAHEDAVRTLCLENGLAFGEIHILGFHGHTILHEPIIHEPGMPKSGPPAAGPGRTWQIGDGPLLARRIGIDVITDFRSADVAAGGQGAPLAPLYHAALAQEIERPVAVLNIGGMANVTYIGEGGALLAFDTGPGNALIDDWTRCEAGLDFDADGALGRAGTVDGRVLAAYLERPWFAYPPPKSLDRLNFDIDSCAGLSPADGAATLTALTAETAARAARHFPEPVRRWLVTGGGRRNPTLMAALGQATGAEVAPVEAVGWDGDALEAQAFAYLAVRVLAGLPLSLPDTTGVNAPMPGGVVHRAPR